ncbi:MAG: hypothetical protein HYZ47_00375 [Simkania negevensis]|nr:hypothetical protein [Simkania negevensis]
MHQVYRTSSDVLNTQKSQSGLHVNDREEKDSGSVSSAKIRLKKERYEGFSRSPNLTTWSVHALFSALHLVVVFFFLFLGIFFIALPNAYGFRFHMSDLLLKNPEVFKKIGWFIFGGGVLLFFTFYFLNRKSYLELRMGTSKAMIEKPIVREYVGKYWQELFPGKKIPFDVRIHRKNRLEIIATFPDEEEGEELLQRVEKELSLLLKERLGYDKLFYLTLTER